jgi:hypothetical protein
MGNGSIEDILKDWDKEELENARSRAAVRNNDDNTPGTIKPDTSEITPLELLVNYSITEEVDRLRQQMLEDKFVLKNIAIMGQWTVIFGAPNSGKTLITNWLLRESIVSGDIDGKMVFYCNADDTHPGLVQKTELARAWGMRVLAPHQRGFTTQQMLGLMTNMAEGHYANGVVLILDTLKKFTDLMDKKLASQFGVTARGFVSAGGTLIALAHTNKHVGVDRKRVPSGTSDVVDDCDCAFVIDKISTDERYGETTHTVEFTNIKSRGEVSSKVGFSYKKTVGQPYHDLLSTVKPIDRTHLENVREQAHAQSALDDDASVIETVFQLIEGGTVTKDKIIRCTHDLTGESISRVRNVLEQRAGLEYARGHRWSVSKGANNRYLYAVLPAPL